MSGYLPQGLDAAEVADDELPGMWERADFLGGAPDEVRGPNRTRPATRPTASVILFKPSGKFYTEELWEIPEGAIGPYDMARSKDFRRIGGGAVLVDTQEPWGFPHLFPGVGT